MTIPILLKTEEINTSLGIEEQFTIRKLIEFICMEYDVTEEDLKSKNKAVPLPDARHLIFYQAHKNSYGTCDAIGKILNRDHSTVIFGKKKIIDLYDRDNKIHDIVDKMNYMFN